MTRRKQRIPTILKLLRSRENIKKVLHFWFDPKPGTQMEIGMPFYDIDTITDKIIKDFDEISKTWKEFPDLRLQQILILVGVMDNYPGFYYHLEDEMTCIRAKIVEGRDILYWGNSFSSKGERLPVTVYKKIADLETSHLENILKDYKEGKYKIRAYFYQHLREELENRKQNENNKTIK